MVWRLHVPSILTTHRTTSTNTPLDYPSVHAVSQISHPSIHTTVYSLSRTAVVELACLRDRSPAPIVQASPQRYWL